MTAKFWTTKRVQELVDAVLSGATIDDLMEKFNKNESAIRWAMSTHAHIGFNDAKTKYARPQPRSLTREEIRERCRNCHVEKRYSRYGIKPYSVFCDCIDCIARMRSEVIPLDKFDEDID